jgi:hypothetical protein
MLLRTIALGVLIFLAACGHQTGPFYFHISGLHKESGRPIVSRLGYEVRDMVPVIYYDPDRGVVNGVLISNASPGILARSAHRLSLRLSSGLDAAPDGFLNVAHCMQKRSCGEQEILCEVSSVVSLESYKKSFDEFSSHVIYGGYGALGVLYDRRPDGSVKINVPMFAGCSTSETLLSQAWANSHPVEPAQFHMTSKTTARQPTG